MLSDLLLIAWSKKTKKGNHHYHRTFPPKNQFSYSPIGMKCVKAKVLAIAESL